MNTFGSAQKAKRGQKKVRKDSWGIAEQEGEIEKKKPGRGHF